MIIQPDLGTSLSILILGAFILFLAGIRLWKFALGLIITILSIPIFLQYIKPYQRDRIISFLNPESDPLGKGYQSYSIKNCPWFWWMRQEKVFCKELNPILNIFQKANRFYIYFDWGRIWISWNNLYYFFLFC